LGTGFYGSNDPTNSVKALKDVVVLRTRLQSHRVHLIMLQSYTCMNIQWYTKYKNEPKRSEMGPVRQNPIQRIVRSVHMHVHCTVHNCCTQHCTEHTW